MHIYIYIYIYKIGNGMKVELSETFKQILVFTKGNVKRRVRKIRILRLRELRVIR